MMRQHSPTTDWTVQLRRGGERQARFLRELIPLFLVECPQLVAAIRQAIACGDGVGLKFAAHTLKSSMCFLADDATTALVNDLESMGRRGDLTGAVEASAALEEALAALLPVLADFVRQSTELEKIV